MAVVAGVRAADRYRQIGAGYAQAMVLARMDHHVVLRWHMAGDALRSFAAGLVLVVFGRIKFACAVTANAKRIALCPQLLGVRIMAIHAGHAVLVHFALQERAPDVNLFALLAIRVVIGWGEHREAMGIF